MVADTKETLYIFSFAYLHLTKPNSKCQCHVYFECEYVVDGPTTTLEIAIKWEVDFH